MTEQAILTKHALRWSLMKLTPQNWGCTQWLDRHELWGMALLRDWLDHGYDFQELKSIVEPNGDSEGFSAFEYYHSLYRAQTS